jgi:hypothetical protein
MGIVPGQSTIPQAHTQVAAVLKTFGYTLDPLYEPWNGLGIFLSMRNKTGHKDSDALINFASQGRTDLLATLAIWRGQTDAIMPTFGDFVSLFGPPTCLTSAQVSLTTTVFLMYYNDSSDKSTFGVVVEADKLSWIQPIYGFSIGHNVNPAYGNTCASLLRAIRWHGWVNAGRYLAETQQ